MTLLDNTAEADFLSTERNRAILVTAWLTSGQLDSSMDDIVQAISVRRQAINVTRQSEMQTGDRVRFVRGKPKAIIGITGTIAGKRDGKLVVTIDTQFRSRIKRYVNPADGTTTAPVSLVEQIS